MMKKIYLIVTVFLLSMIAIPVFIFSSVRQENSNSEIVNLPQESDTNMSLNESQHIENEEPHFVQENDNGNSNFFRNMVLFNLLTNGFNSNSGIMNTSSNTATDSQNINNSNNPQNSDSSSNNQNNNASNSNRQENSNNRNNTRTPNNRSPVRRR